VSLFAQTDLTCDAFLGGQVTVFQPRTGYRAGIDPVLLAASVPARTGQSVLELGCGAGVASFCLAARVPGVSITGIEVQPSYADLARRNAVHNRFDVQIVQADLSALPLQVKQIRFDHVIANPPYFRAGHRSRSADPGREVALAEDTPLAVWIEVASRRLAAKGTLHVVHRAERLPDLLAATAGLLGSVEVLPLAARVGRAAHLVILRARKGGRAAFRLHAPLILHEGSKHTRDGESYCAEINSILRHGTALNWPEAD
jgi:tRNA1(Val) A37 N6-methylase TrmN6